MWLDTIYGTLAYGSLGARKHGSRQSHWLRDPTCLHAKQLRRARLENDSAYNQACSIVEGFAISGLFGNPVLTSWPVAWYRDDTWIGVPPEGGIVDDDYVGHKRDSFVRLDRGLAVNTLIDCWHEYTHRFSTRC